MSGKNFEQVRTEYLQTLKNQNPSAHVHVGSDNHVRASAYAEVAEGQYQHQEWILNQAFADTANSANLERHAAQYNIYRKVATAASGTVRFTGNVGAVYPIGTVLQLDEAIYLTTSVCAIKTGGNNTAHVISTNVGANFNQPANTTVKVSSPPAGGKSNAVLVQMVGGTDTEVDESLLARYLERKRRPPAGGNIYDFRNWCLSIKGVTDAYIYPLRRGNGFVDAVILGEEGIPSQETLKAVQDYVDSVRPVTRKSGFLALPPTISQVAITVEVTTFQQIEAAALKADVESAIHAFFNSLKPGDTLVKSQLEAAISNVYGVSDRNLLVPKQNVQAAITEQDVYWHRPGAITVRIL